MDTDLRAFLLFPAGLVAALVLVPFARSVAFRLGAVDGEEKRRIHTGIVPRLGGLGIFGAFVLPLICCSAFPGAGPSLDILGIGAGSVLVFVAGVFDDIRGLRIRVKLLVEIAAAIIVYAAGVRVTDIGLPLAGPVSLGILSMPVTILWIITVTNAFNLIDGLDGLAGGVGVLLAGAFLMLAGGDPGLSPLLFALMGALIGFLRYNFPPATVFMGDSGSLFVGFFLASISVMISEKVTPHAPMAVFVVAFTLPLVDMLYAVIRRTHRGLPLGCPDREHIHHKLFDGGMSKIGVLLNLCGIHGTIMLFVLAISKSTNAADLGFMFLAAFVLSGVCIFGYVKSPAPFVNAWKGVILRASSRNRQVFSGLLRNDSGDIKELRNISRKVAVVEVEADLDSPKSSL